MNIAGVWGRYTEKGMLSADLLQRIFLLSAIYLVLGVAGLSIAPVHRFASLVWPASGVAMAALLVFGYRLWPGIFVGALLVNIITGAPIWVSLGIAFGNTLQSVVAVYLLRHFVGFRNVFERLGDVLGFVFFAAIASTMVSAVIGTATLLAGDIIFIQQFHITWRAWWIGDMLGALIVTPLLLVWRTRRPLVASLREHALELISLSVLLVAVCVLLFGDFFATPQSSGRFSYLLLVPVVWAALRFGGRGAITATFVISVVATWGTALGRGPFAMENTMDGFLSLQMFIGVVTVTNMILAATVTERRRVEEELEGRLKELAVAKAEIEQEEVRYEALIDGVGDGIVMTDRSGKILLVNRAFESLMGFTSKEAVGKYPIDVLALREEDGRLVQPHERAIFRAIETGSKISVTKFLYRKDKTMFPALVTATPLIIGGETVGAIEIIRDISREQEIDRAKSEFVALASHQLRTPLTTISWFVEALIKGTKGELTVPQKQYLRKIYEADKRMIRLVNDILNVSRIELGVLAVESKRMALSESVNAAIAEFSKEIKQKQLSVKKKYASGLPKLFIDPKLTQIIFHNLLSNAIKYTPEKGKITVSIAKEGGFIVVTVADNGFGIPKKAQQQIFTKFFRADNIKDIDSMGTGLGLYIVKSILGRMGASISFSSQVNRGTRFFVKFPIGDISEGATG